MMARGVAKEQPQLSQRERLLGRQRPTMSYRLLLDSEQVERARAELARVQQETRQTRMRSEPTSQAYRRAEKRVADAEAAVEACYESITLRALPPARMEELAAQYPATSEQMDQAKVEREQAKKRGEEPPPWPQYANEFWPILLAECAEVDMSPEDWDLFLREHVSDGERRGLQLACLQVNERERVADPVTVPKEWSQIANLFLR